MTLTEPKKEKCSNVACLVLGYQDNNWVTSSSEDEFENISMIVENSCSGEISQSWCGKSSNSDDSYVM